MVENKKKSEKMTRWKEKEKSKRKKRRRRCMICVSGERVCDKAREEVERKP
jgi:hypothetical protein